jgi:hypothetical protein
MGRTEKLTAPASLTSALSLLPALGSILESIPPAASIPDAGTTGFAAPVGIANARALVLPSLFRAQTISLARRKPWLQ